ncbi:MAG TPA: M15 family metallopeptidase [Cellvibrionaceae bacterium]
MSAVPPQLTAQQVLGLDASALIDREGVGLIHPHAMQPLEHLRERARLAGFDLQIASGFRDFWRQLAIFNAKASGQRPVIDDAGEVLDLQRMSAREQLYAILRFSALPGTSRHHWGTDFDVYDAAAMPAGYCLQLTQAECQPGAMFGNFHQWLNTELACGDSGFFRPYQTDTGGVAPEPWHISYAPEASLYAAHISVELLREPLAASDIVLKDVILDLLPTVFERFVVQCQYRESQ